MSVRRTTARGVRRVMNARYTPRWAEMMLRRLAHAILPHSLRCRRCGAEFVADAWWSREHARRAYDHFVAVHESQVVEPVDGEL